MVVGDVLTGCASHFRDQHLDFYTQGCAAIMWCSNNDVIGHMHLVVP